jgi:hydroxymethylpyrimidine/phosphomethylpyrimidine kinase
MRPIHQPPVALSIAGSDSGGGAGIQADLRAFALAGVRGATVITCLTAQNRNAISRLEPVSPKMIRAQLEAVFADTPPAAVKTGLLYSAAIIREIARFLRRHPRQPLVVDPVMIATSGRRLLQAEAIATLRRELLPLATLVTPNRPEAEVLTGRKIKTPEDLRAAARDLRRAFGCAILVKGGHLPGTKEAIDVLFDGTNEWLFSAPRAQKIRLHGTGCTYSAAITASLAKERPLASAVREGKQFVTEMIYRELAFSREAS